MMKKLLTIYLSLFFGLTSFAQPANDLCQNAEPITDLDGTCNSFSNVGATATNPYMPPCFGNTNIVWFSFVADGPNADFTVNGVNRPEIAIIGLDGAGGTDLCDINDVLSYGCSNPGGNYNSLTLSITNGSLTPGETYLIAVANNTGGGGGPGTFDLCIDNPPATPGADCASSDPFCTENPATFPAQTNTTAPPGNAYDCLFSQPNPAWFYLEIGANGSIDLEFSNSNNLDIDFIIWGPLTDLSTGCSSEIQDANNVADCSYAINSTEYGTITNAVAGETYILMVTNYSNSPTDITIEQVGGTGTTNCGIVLPISLLDFSVSNYKDANELWWSTASEDNNDYFIVEHSIDGKTWNEINRVDGAGNSTSQNDYYLLHRDFGQLINYYRLKQVDYDGTITDHGIISIDNRTDVKLAKRINSLGQEVGDDYVGVVYEYYSDGSTRKVMQ